MGIRYRGRTKGKDTWLNYSWSSKRGLNVSLSAKAGPFTWNSGNKRYKSRVTTNLPGGFYHVSYGKGKRKTNQSYAPSTSSDDGTGVLGALVVFGIMLGLFLAFSTYFWWTIGAIVAVTVAFGLYKMYARNKDMSLVREFEGTTKENQSVILELAEAAESDPEGVRSVLQTSFPGEDIDETIRQLKVIRKKYASV